MALCPAPFIGCFSKPTRIRVAPRQTPDLPDLNPVERYWAWLRKKLRTMDLADAVKKRPVLSKVKYTARAKRVLKSKKSQQVAAACAKGLRKVCKEVVRNKGAETHG